MRVGGIDADLGRRAADTFPYLVNVRPYRPPGERRAALRRNAARATRSSTPTIFRRDTGEEPPSDLLGLFREVLEEVADASA